jgi:hypothetical protein
MRKKKKEKGFSCAVVSVARLKILKGGVKK